VSDITDAVGRMQELNAALSDWDRIREEGERISREEAYRVLALEIATLRAENERLRAQCTPDSPSTPGEGTRQTECPYVTGTVTRYCTLTPFTLTDAERFVLREVMDIYAGEDDVASNEIAAVIDGLLERNGSPDGRETGQ